MTSARRRKTPDVLRIGMAVSYPGIDPRTWVSAGRIEVDPQAFRWDPRFGWVADVTLHGGPLDQETEIPCRPVGQIHGAGFGEFLPPEMDAEVVVALPGGTPEESPVILGGISNSEAHPPASVNGLPIIPGSVAVPSTPASVSPFDTEIKVSPHNRREEFSGDRFVQASKHTIEADEAIAGLLLGSRAASEAFVLGTSFLGDNGALLADLAATCATMAEACTGPLVPLNAGFKALAKSLGEAAAKQPSYASQKIIGE